MRLRNSLVLALCVSSTVSAGTFVVSPGAPVAWSAILSSVGHAQAISGSGDIYVAPPNAANSPDWRTKVTNGAALILEGASPLATSFGFVPTSATVSTIHIVDEHNPTLPIVWNKGVDIPRFDIPSTAHVYAKERWSDAPMVAGLRVGGGAVLWIATDPGTNGYERFPYLPQALANLGYQPSFRANRLWAFFDYSYRSRADPDYLAQHWRASGIAALHAAAWHFYDSDPARDEYLRQLIAACHRHGILVYAWLELPHVSDQFWNQHPEWREKTALLQDAQLDWRKLMNLQNPECAAAVRKGLQLLARRFDWDGINLAELYFESLEGASNPARFTPMSDDVRKAFRAQSGWDPIELWKQRTDAGSLREFLDFRASLARRMQEEWLGFAAQLRGVKPDLDIVLTHVDDRFDAGMKDAIGADAARVLPLLDTGPFTFLIEDPATVWNLGPQRYPEIAKRYAPLTTHRDRLAIDINIVDRYQDVYPTKQQTGAELFELVHMASGAFQRVALYFENSILKSDLPLLSAAAASVTGYARDGRRVSVDSAADLEVAWPGSGALVDGKPWPLIDAAGVLLPAGRHTLDVAPKRTAISVLDLNANLLAASAEGNRLKFRYSSDSRAIVRFDQTPSALAIDAHPCTTSCLESTTCTVLLPRGSHEITAE